MTSNSFFSINIINYITISSKTGKHIKTKDNNQIYYVS